ncbi:MAG: GreA/GreB family elongation factor [Verrucomicrobiota bacterium]
MEGDSQLIASISDLAPQLAAKLQKLQPGYYCVHKSWGVGKIKSWDRADGSIAIDFANKPDHSMDFEFAAQSLRPIEPDHIEAKMFEDLAGMQAMAENDTAGLLHILVQSLQQEATPERIEKLLVPTLMPAERWKKWWDAVKRAAKKDARYELPARRNLPILFHDTPRDHHAHALEEFRRAVGAQSQIAILPRLQKNWKKGEDPAIAQEIIDLINRTLTSVAKPSLPLCVELILARDEFSASVGSPESAPGLTDFLPLHADRLIDILNAIPAHYQEVCLKKAQIVFGEKWTEIFLAMIPQASGRIMEFLYHHFKTAGLMERMQTAFDLLIRERKMNPDLLIWLCKSKKEEIRPFVGPQLFSAILSALEYDQLADYKKGTRLRDLLVNDKTIVPELLATAREEDVRDITRAILLTSVFEEMDKRSVLASFIKLHPFVQNMIIGAEESKVHTKVQSLVVSWGSLEKRKAELEEIINKKIPENSRDIATARSYGDLSENHEFKAAKEMQTVLMRRRAEIEQELAMAQGSDFKNVDTSEVNIGTCVYLINTANQQPINYTILGAWDSDPEKGVISYLTAVAKNLLNHKVGDIVELPLDETQTLTVKIESIEAYNP